MADQEWVVVKSRVTREEATALARYAASENLSVSHVIRKFIRDTPIFATVMRGEGFDGR